MKSTLIQIEEIKTAAKVLRAINHKLRRDMLYILETKKLSVYQIQKACKLEQSVCSQHLGILRKAGIVGFEAIGKERYYYINHQKVEQINESAIQLVAKNMP